MATFGGRTEMMCFAIATIVAQALAAGQEPALPVVVVEDAQEIRRAVGFKVDDAFVPTQNEADAPRQDLSRYLAAERAREKNDDRQLRLRRIGMAADRYLWHCGGYMKEGQKYLFCTFVRYEPSSLSRLRQKHFPVIYDGGISVCRCYFNVKLGRIVRLDWNGEV